MEFSLGGVLGGFAYFYSGGEFVSHATGSRSEDGLGVFVGGDVLCCYAVAGTCFERGGAIGGAEVVDGVTITQGGKVVCDSFSSTS